MLQRWLNSRTMYHFQAREDTYRYQWPMHDVLNVKWYWFVWKCGVMFRNWYVYAIFRIKYMRSHPTIQNSHELGRVSVSVCMQRLWFRILVFHLICMRIHNKIILVTLLKCLLRTECNQWLFCRFCFHAQILTALVHTQSLSIYPSICLYLCLSVHAVQNDSMHLVFSFWFFGTFILVAAISKSITQFC